ncbi:DNA polymerase III subunit beta [Candidatus Saccharibacteria bacterium]|nr:DNA polymerase III subunit beta [Candidatus Saccharibacteria bacterium]
MEIEASAEKLSKALNNVSRIATSKVTLPVLNNVLIKVKNKQVSLITTNLDMAIIDFLPVSNSKDGVVTVPAKLLAEFVSTLPKEEKVKIISKDDKITITADKYSSTINGSPADDFPELPEIDEKKAVVFKIGAEEFKTGINQVLVASSNDYNRPALTGVHFYTSDKALYAVATDGYRLAKKKFIKNVQSEIKVTIPSNSLQEVVRSLNDEVEEIEMSFNDDLVRFRLGELEIISKIIDAEYPNPDNLIPKKPEISVEVDREELIRVTKLAGLFARHATNDIIACEVKAPDIFSVYSIANEYGENSSSLITETKKEGKIFLTSRYLLDALNVFTNPKILINFNNGSENLNIIERILVLKEPGSDDYIHTIIPIPTDDIQ